jgi:cytochrome c553
VYNRPPFLSKNNREFSSVKLQTTIAKSSFRHSFRKSAVSVLAIVIGASVLGSAAGQEGAAAATAEGNADAGKTKSATCAACHGPDGNSIAPDWPSLAGQHASYIVRQLKAFKGGDRPDVTMKPFADMLSEQDMLDIAAYFSTQKPTPKGADPALVSLGQQIYRGGVPERGVAACIACHGPGGHGNAVSAYPRIGGQHSAYVSNALHKYASGDRRSDTEVNQMMRNVAALLLDDEIKALSSYVQGLN